MLKMNGKTVVEDIYFCFDMRNFAYLALQGEVKSRSEFKVKFHADWKGQETADHREVYFKLLSLNLLGKRN